MRHVISKWSDVSDKNTTGLYGNAQEVTTAARISQQDPSRSYRTVRSAYAVAAPPFIVDPSLHSIAQSNVRVLHLGVHEQCCDAETGRPSSMDSYPAPPTSQHDTLIQTQQQQAAEGAQPVAPAARRSWSKRHSSTRPAHGAFGGLPCVLWC